MFWFFEGMDASEEEQEREERGGEDGDDREEVSPTPGEAMDLTGFPLWSHFLFVFFQRDDRRSESQSSVRLRRPGDGRAVI